MNKTYLYKPLRFFILTYLITWISWFLAAFASYRKGGEWIYILLMLPGLIAPFGVALWMILRSNSPLLKNRLKEHLFNLKLIKPLSIVPMLLIMPAAIVISTLISTGFGQSMTQLHLAQGFSFSLGAVPVLIVLILAAAFEELGWRSYAMDSLEERMNYFCATLLFALLWAGWHLPLFFVKGYYHNEIIRMNFIYGINFMVAIVPMAFIISWLCKLNRGSIPVAIVFHFFINICQEAFQITQDTKCIETLVLLMIAAVIVLLDRKLFFEKKEA